MSTTLWIILLASWMGLPTLSLRHLCHDANRTYRIDTALEAGLTAMRNWLRDGQGLAMRTQRAR